MSLVGAAATWYSVRNRRKKSAYVVQLIRTHNLERVLLVGSETADFPWSNLIERAVIANARFVVASGLGPVIELDTRRVLCDGRQLPFADDTFDLVLSNAVIEHVGDEAAQRRFVDEHVRVGRCSLITTPNRWFPVESHTRTLFRHWSAAWRAEQGAHFSRLLSRREFREMLPRSARVTGWWLSPTFVATMTKGG